MGSEIMNQLLGGGIIATQAFPIAEFLCFIVLILITVFRRKLSSNDEYRSEIHTVAAGVTSERVCNIVTKRDRSPSSNDCSTCFTTIILDDNILLSIAVYLTDTDIAELSLTSKIVLDNCTSDFLWEQLWMLTFGAMWNDKNLADIRKIRGISWNPTPPEITNDSIDILERKITRPLQGWMIFYKEFEFCWMDWLMAGCSTSEYCLIGLYGSLYDITNFLPEHPVSFYQDSLLYFTLFDSYTVTFVINLSAVIFPNICFLCD